MKTSVVFLLLFTLLINFNVTTFALRSDFIIDNQPTYDTFFYYVSNEGETYSITEEEFLILPSSATDFVVKILNELGREVGTATFKSGGQWVIKASVSYFGAAATASMGGLLVLSGFSLAALVVSVDQSRFLHAYNLNGSIIDQNGNEITPNSAKPHFYLR